MGKETLDLCKKLIIFEKENEKLMKKLENVHVSQPKLAA